MTAKPASNSSLDDLVSRNSGKLTEADTRLLDVLLQDPMRAALENGTEISERAGVHPASAVRLARRLGFDGYPAFRAFLQSNLARDGRDFGTASARMAARLVQAEEGGVLASIIDGEVAALNGLRSAISDADIRGFATVLRGARRVFLFGQGHAASLSALITLRLVRSGYDATDLAPRTHQMAMTLSGLGAGDVIWLLSFRAPHQAVLSLSALAQERGATVLALTDADATPIRPAPDRLIAASRGRAGETQSLNVPMTISNAIILDLAGIDEGKSLKALENYRNFRGSLPDHWH